MDIDVFIRLSEIIEVMESKGCTVEEIREYVKEFESKLKEEN